MAGALFLAALVASCLRGALPPVDLRAVCLVRAIAAKHKAKRESRLCDCELTDSDAQLLKGVSGAVSEYIDRAAPTVAPVSIQKPVKQTQIVFSRILLSASSRLLASSAVMAPKTAAAAAAAEKKPAPAKKSVAKKSTAGRKKGAKKAVESYKIYIYKVRHTAIV